MNEIMQIDRYITVAVNSCHSPYSDNFFWTFTQTVTWIPLLLLFIIAVWRNYGASTTLFILILTGLSILLSDQISSSLIKPSVHRLRPTHDPEINALIHTVNGYKGGLYGFVSSHAANAFAFVTVTALHFKDKWYAITFYVWAALTAYSRIYLGVHYFGDVICGAAIGISVATLLYFSGRISSGYTTVKFIPRQISPIKPQYGKGLALSMIAYICFIAIIEAFV